MAEIDRQLAAVALRQHGVVSLADVIAAGGDRGRAAERVRSGRWEPVQRGVYRLAGQPWTYEAQVLAGVLAAGPGAVASHLCAARLLGFGFPTAAPELSIPRGRFHRPIGVRVHQSTDLDRTSTVVHAGIPVTDAGRTILDVGRYIGPQALRRAVEQARRIDAVTWPDLVRTLFDHARRGRHGIRNLRQVLEVGMPLSEVTDTDSELMALSLLREHDLPEAVLHHRVYDTDGTLFAELDLAFVAIKAALEIDGTAHLEPAVKRHDDERDHELRRRGWLVRRVWWEIPVREPARFLRIARDLVADATANLAAHT